MIETGFDARVKINQVIENQLPEFLLSESPKSAEFLKQYYISQEYQGGTVDIVENLDQYLKLDNLTAEIISGKTILSQDISSTSTNISVDSTKGFPPQYGLFKIDNEIITYTGISGNTFTGCIRGFSGVTSYNKVNSPEELEFNTTNAESHLKDSQVINLSALFLQEFYKKLKYTLTPGLENTEFVSDLDVSNFIKEAKSLYQSKGTVESFRILFNVLYGETPTVFDLENLLIKPSAANYLRREVVIAELLNSPANPLKLVGQTIRKSTDPNTQASVSEVEILTRKRKTYYKISLFVGYNEVDLIEGQFNIQPKTKVLENVSIGASIISVDTTIGFGQTGTLISGTNKITYTDKSVNQFYGCSGVASIISASNDVRSDEIVYGYEDGDETKKVELRITGVLSKFVPLSEIYYVDEKEIVSVKNVGEIIDNPENDKTYREIFANSWIYNTSSRYQIGNISGSTFTLLSKIDKSSLKVGDNVDILVRNTQNIVASNALVTNVNATNKQIILTNLGSFSPSSLDYDLRRKIVKSSSSGAPIQFGNGNIISNVQNLYVDGEEYAYVASNSLPGYTITKNLTEISIPEATGSPQQSIIGQGYIQGYSNITLKYSQISFNTSVPFISGDAIVYEASNSIPGLVSGETYYVEVLSPNNKIRLYKSRSFVGGNSYIEFETLNSGSGAHNFILLEEKTKIISPQNLLRKFPINPNLKNSALDETQPGSIGMLINGVEIVSPKSNDKLYYGPLNSIKILNSGKDYDAINPPTVSIPSPSIGTTALARVVVNGSVKKVVVDPQEFDLDTVFSATITGGNGSGAILQPIVSRRYRELEFDARPLSFGGGLDLVNETITFDYNHNFIDGETIVYNSNGNLPLGIGTFGSLETTGTLVSGSSYYAKIVNSSSIKLYNTLNDYFVGINTVGITTVNNIGIHKFRTLEKNTLRSIKVLNSGSNYENRQLYVKPVGISTYNHTVFFPNHNFNNGDVVNYSYTENPISGISTTNNYFISKVDKDTFRLSDAGIGTISRNNFERGEFVKFSSVGSGYHIFKYPEISVNITVSYGSTVIRQISAVPTITGPIVDVYLYEEGSGYGSNNIINLKKLPKITLQNGKNAELKPIIKDGRLVKVDVLSRGSEYFSTPSLIVQGSGVGADIRPVIQNGKVVDVIIINSGIGYTQTNTSIRIVPAGSGALLEASIRSLTVNKQYRFDKEILVDNNNLQYAWVGYAYDIAQNEFNETSSSHSPLIGWAYDGNPIYGPYGYSDSENSNSQVKLLKPGYVLDTSNIVDRPSTSIFGPGFFINDYTFDASGDLDKHNGRFCKTPEFPLGTYAYFVGVTTNFSTNSLDPVYPYFIGDTFRSSLLTENSTLDQSFDFNNSNLSRNTYPYKVNDAYADNDFIVESNEIINQTSIVESVSEGSIESLSVLDPGDNYKIGDLLNFDNNDTSGGGLSAFVSSLVGKTIESINTQVETYNSIIFEWQDNSTVVSYLSPYHQLLDNDSIVISGLSTSVENLSGSHKIGVTTDRTTLFGDVPSNIVPRAVVDLYVSHIPQSVSIGSSIVIENEVLEVLNIFSNNSIIRARRSDVGTSHSTSTSVNILPNKISIPLKTNYFDSKKNEKVYFNPKQSVGIGTTIGGSISLNYTVGIVTNAISVPVRSIYLPNHPFKTGQRVTLSKYSGSSAFIVSNSSSGVNFNLPSSGNSQTVYVINKSKDFIGLTTEVGITTNTDGLFFISNGSDSYEYSLESNYTQVTGNISKINSTIFVSDSHGLSNNDQITLKVVPNLSVGIGQSSKVRLKYENIIDKVVANPIGFNSSSIDTATDIITISSHELKTGDKVFYNSLDNIASGLSTDTYFVYKIDNDRIKLSETLFDLQSNPPKTIDIIGVGGSRHEISLVNPELLLVKNNNLVFDVSDSSLLDYQLKFYYDMQFTSEFIGLGNSSNFNVSGVGTIGVSSTASISLNYYSEFPSILYYNLQKSGEIISPDTGVKNHSQISLVNSAYSRTYAVSGVGSTSFNISLDKTPEKLSYISSECDSLNYTTTSKSAKGGIDKASIIFGGYNYKKTPNLLSINSDEGADANIKANSKNIGLINKIRILESGFEYSADKTLEPQAYISPFISITDSNTIKKVNVINGGKNYSTPPNLIVKNPETNEIVDNIQSLKANVYGSSISSVEIVSPINGLASINHEIVPINNSNGVGISSIISSNSGIITCILSTPILGFSTFASPFSAGDKILVENVQKEGTSGTGFNSEDYNYSYFDVVSYTNTNPAILVYDMSSEISNPGLAKTVQSAFASVVNIKNVPQFEIIQEFTEFYVGEQLLSDLGLGFELRDLVITKSSKDYIKVNGSYLLKNGEKIKGKTSGIIATVNNTINHRSKFDVDYSLRRDYGWSTDIGKLNDNNQVSSDNDYYQNLSYTVKSTIEFEDLVSPVNSLLHTSGLKNFADTQIQSKPLVGYAITSVIDDLITLDVFEEKRVDSINNYDFALDINTYQGKSKYLKLKNKKLSSFINCISNRVLVIDDVSRQFSNKDSNLNLYSDISTIEDTYNKYLVQIKELNSSNIQVTELIVLSNDIEVFTLEKGALTNTPQVLGDLSGVIDNDVKSLRFSPTNPYDYDYDVKVLESKFNSSIVGINTLSIGFINLTGVNTSVGIGKTIDVISFDKRFFKSLFANIQIINTATNVMNYVELFLDHDGTNTYLSEYYFDTNSGISTNFLGSFDSSIDGNNLYLNFYNDEKNNLLIRSKVVGFGTTAVGIGTYRFISPDQTEGTEKTVFFESNYTSSSPSEANIIGINTETMTTVKSLVKVSYGQTSALHQVVMIQDGTDIYTLQYPFLSIGSTSGIGTFGGEFSGTKSILKFYPDNNVTSFDVQSFSEVFYTENDYDNISPDLEYGSVTETLNLSFYNGINGSRINRLNFDLKYQGTPIYAKTFNPSSTSVLDFNTGIFTIKNHFFSTGERLIYSPKSTVAGIAATSVGIGSTLTSSGIVTNRLPKEVYAINLNSDQFRLSTRKDYALAGIYVTFTSTGTGNAHQLEMSKKFEKSIISINGVVQKPITYTPISYQLINNGGQIGIADTYFSISGISTLRPKDILKIDEEFINIISVGLGTSQTGPITGIGTYQLVETKRGFVGTSATSHSDFSTAQLYRGSFNIIGSEIYFTEAPKGGGGIRNTASNLEFPYADFGGRVYLRDDYTNNLLFDDISDQFDGLDKDFNLSVQGIQTSAFESGSGLLFINDIFQPPTTTNNLGNNYSVEASSGISTVIFTGISSSNGDVIISDFDVNQNQLPRGGLIVSLGSTPGLGFAPLVGASVTAIVTGGSIVAVGVGTTDIVGSGYRGTVSIGVTDSLHVGAAASITATVGAGGTLTFNVIYGGSGYVNPTIKIPQPSYENLEVIGVSREGIGSTTKTGKNLLVTLDVGASSTTGIGSTLFEVSSFKISRPGYGFKVGDVFKPVGLVTDRNLLNPVSEFELTVLDTFTDSFSSWQFGELDYIDSISNLQNGSRDRFPLYYNGRLLSFEKDPSSLIDLNSVLLIFINGVIQEPIVAYQFEGGTSFTFTTPPRSEDKISIFFYRGTREIDSKQVNVNETIKIGDLVQVYKNDAITNTITQDIRNIDNIPASDTLETNIYSSLGVDETNYKPLTWTKQKIDGVINGDYVYKSRDSIESQIYPTARIIKDIGINTTSIFVDNAKFFNYEGDNYSSPLVSNSFDALIIQGTSPVSAGLTATVSAAGTIQSLTIVNSGSGYIGTSISVKISAPPNTKLGVGTVASAIAPVLNGSISTPITIINPGLGYTISSPPQVIVDNPSFTYENVNSVLNVEGFAGIVTGITTSSGVGGHPLAIKFFLNTSSFSGLQVGYPLYVFDTSVGSGVTSVDFNDNSIVGVGTTCLDNIYYIHSLSVSGGNAQILSNISTTTNISGINTFGSSSSPRGKFSWGRLYNFSRSNPVSIAVTGLTVDSGLTTFPVIQRRGFGLRDTGAIKKTSNI